MPCCPPQQSPCTPAPAASCCPPKPAPETAAGCCPPKEAVPKPSGCCPPKEAVPKPSGCCPPKETAPKPSGCCPPKEAAPKPSASCCPPKDAAVASLTSKAAALALTDDEIVKAVTDSYGARALTAGDDTAYAENVAAAFGYSAEELQAIPAEANMGLSCGNPTGTASIKEGERVLDLGSGGGMDIFLAATKIGSTGQAIGLDGSQEMIALARRNAEKKGLKPPHVAFVHANLDKALPIESNSIDCVISNCVINLLSPTGKKHIFKEVHRVLKPGGRVVLDDLVAKKPLPDQLRNDLDSYISCISGAMLVSEFREYLAEAGFGDVLLVDTKSDLNVYWEGGRSGGCCTGGAPSASTDTNLPYKPDVDINEWIASYQIYALKPKTDEEVALPENALRDWRAEYPDAE